MTVVEGLPWLVFTFANLDWDWLVRNVKREYGFSKLKEVKNPCAGNEEGPWEST
jgi:hypothetical protein